MVTWSLRAEKDLQNLHDYISQDSAFYAKKISRDIVQKTTSLNHFPKIGRTIPELNQESIREVPIHAYRIIYEIRQSGIYILTIVHKRRNFNAQEL